MRLMRMQEAERCTGGAANLIDAPLQAAQTQLPFRRDAADEGFDEVAAACFEGVWIGDRELRPVIEFGDIEAVFLLCRFLHCSPRSSPQGDGVFLFCYRCVKKYHIIFHLSPSLKYKTQNFVRWQILLALLGEVPAQHRAPNTTMAWARVRIQDSRACG